MILGQIPGTCVFRIEQKVNASVIGEILIPSNHAILFGIKGKGDLFCRQEPHNNLNILNQEGAFIFNSSPEEPLEIHHYKYAMQLNRISAERKQRFKTQPEIGGCININKKQKPPGFAGGFFIIVGSEGLEPSTP